jgi:hypothetical protein
MTAIHTRQEITRIGSLLDGIERTRSEPSSLDQGERAGICTPQSSSGYTSVSGTNLRRAVQELAN